MLQYALILSLIFHSTQIQPAREDIVALIVAAGDVYVFETVLWTEKKFKYWKIYI